MMLHYGNFLVRLGDGGVDDPWFQKGHAIHLLLNGDNSLEWAEDFVDAHGGFTLPAQGGGGNGDGMEATDGSVTY